MKKQDFKIVLLRAFAHQIRSFADFMLAHTEEEEHTSPEGDSTNQDVEEMSASWPTTIEADQPPAHWLERVRQGAPEVSIPSIGPLKDSTPPASRGRVYSLKIEKSSKHTLEQRGSLRQQGSNVPNQPVDIPEHNSELLPAEIADTTLLAKNQHIQSRKPHDQYSRIDSGVPMLEEGGNVQPLVPSLRPFLTLDEADDVGEDVHPWPRSPLAALDVGEDVHPWPRWPLAPSPSRSFSPILQIRDNSRERGEEGREEHQPLRRSFPDSPPTNQTRSRRDLSAWTSETYPQMRWPSLPQGEATEQQSWEMMRRSWERQQRLNEEQRGVSWNA